MRQTSMANFHRLLMTPPGPIEGLDQVKMQSEQLVSVWTINRHSSVSDPASALPTKQTFGATLAMSLSRSLRLT